MSQALNIETEAALQVRRAVRGSRLVGAIWSGLYVIKLRVAAVEFIRSPDATVDRKALLRKIGASAQRWLDAAAGLVGNLPGLIKTWAERRRARLELLAYLAQDHRAAADMGTTRADADDWAQRPFWRP
jgi:uncharacterized protein YjiS (DUF1127 family)